MTRVNKASASPRRVPRPGINENIHARFISGMKSSPSVQVLAMGSTSIESIQICGGSFMRKIYGRIDHLVWSINSKVITSVGGLEARWFECCVDASGEYFENFLECRISCFIPLFAVESLWIIVSLKLSENFLFYHGLKKCSKTFILLPVIFFINIRVKVSSDDRRKIG